MPKQPARTYQEPEHDVTAFPAKGAHISLTFETQNAAMVNSCSVTSDSAECFCVHHAAFVKMQCMHADVERTCRNLDTELTGGLCPALSSTLFAPEAGTHTLPPTCWAHAVTPCTACAPMRCSGFNATTMSYALKQEGKLHVRRGSWLGRICKYIISQSGNLTRRRSSRVGPLIGKLMHQISQRISG